MFHETQAFFFKRPPQGVVNIMTKVYYASSAFITTDSSLLLF